MTASLSELDAQILAAHRVADYATLVALYRTAAQRMLACGAVDAGCFYLTHAYIFALETGHGAAKAIHKELVVFGREE